MNKNVCFRGVKVLLTIFCVCYAIPGLCLEPEEILVVANRRMKGSVDLAHYYMDRRLIPKANFLSLALTLNEIMSRKARPGETSIFFTNGLRLGPEERWFTPLFP